ncbi:MAG: hypothetical protein V7744_19870 [Pseudomonadales bacterium]
MIKLVFRLVLATSAVFSVNSMAEMTRAEAVATVQQMEEDGATAADIIDALLEEEFILEDVAEISVSAAATESYELALTRTAICMADDEPHARDVGAKAIAAANEYKDNVTGQSGLTLISFVQDRCAADRREDCGMGGNGQYAPDSPYSSTGTAVGGSTISPNR